MWTLDPRSQRHVNSAMDVRKRWPRLTSSQNKNVLSSLPNPTPRVAQLRNPASASAQARSPRIRLANDMSLSITVTRLAWIAQRFV
eukprot:CAMPEP_0117576980 /NCGR_PEP_ID=MMETSP0784-20121206/63134_1 /TAXON_ID=39447 /ORGANISM="" /LENGTH=85 /DNA_ID=CAMNT_0005376363 /DNA_START=10 /DNA_END=263 /DNA_ORIENTATION=-